MSLFDPAPAVSPAEAFSASRPLPEWSGPGDPMAPRHLEPVFIEQVAECTFKAKPCGLCGKPKSNTLHRKKNVEEGLPFCRWKRQNGCARCGRAKGDLAHFGAPESFNVFAGRDPNVYRSLMDTWKAILVPLLEASELPKGLAHVLVEGEVSFGDGRERDQGNARVLIEKALGDALVSAGYLPADTWGHYEFGGYQRTEEHGVSAVRLVLFPTLPTAL